MISLHVEPLASLIAKWKLIPSTYRTFLVGVDGCGGSGKSTFARALGALDSAIIVVQMDDFFLPSSKRPSGDSSVKPIGGDFDWRRLEEQVILPLTRDTPGRYQRYDWDRDQLAEWHDIPVGGIVIVEGIYSTRRELSPHYQVKVWVEAPRSIRLQRGLTRDGEAARERWEKQWMPAEDRYIDEHTPSDYSDMLVDGSGTVTHDAHREYVRMFSEAETRQP